MQPSVWHHMLAWKFLYIDWCSPGHPCYPMAPSTFSSLIVNSIQKLAKLYSEHIQTEGPHCWRQKDLRIQASYACQDQMSLIHESWSDSFPTTMAFLSTLLFSTILCVCVADCRKNLYDGVEEYYVVTGEKGQRAQEESQEEIRRSTQKLEASNCFHLQQPNVHSDEGNTCTRHSCCCKQMRFRDRFILYINHCRRFTFPLYRFSYLHIYIYIYMWNIYGSTRKKYIYIMICSLCVYMLHVRMFGFMIYIII